MNERNDTQQFPYLEDAKQSLARKIEYEFRALGTHTSGRQAGVGEVERGLDVRHAGVRLLGHAPSE